MLLQKLQTKSFKKYPPAKGDCPSKKKRKQQLRDQWAAWWLLKYRKRYERMFNKNQPI